MDRRARGQTRGTFAEEWRAAGTLFVVTSDHGEKLFEQLGHIED